MSKEKPTRYNCIEELVELGVNWLAVCPFAFMESGETYVRYNTPDNWYGDQKIGLVKQIVQAKEKGLKVLIKPHFWVKGEGWPGDFNPGEKKWVEWETNYTNYLIYLAKIGDSLGVEMLCLGTEFKNSTNRRPNYWRSLISKVRKEFSGELTYAANWDNYNNILFWDQLDYIAIDAYFPLKNKVLPSSEELEKAWGKHNSSMKSISTRYKKKVIFTEYGYRSTDTTAYQQWLIEGRIKDEKVNLLAQTNAYQGLFNAVWNEDWFAGGFLWKWYCEPEAGGLKNSDYTPQGKPVLELIEKIYHP